MPKFILIDRSLKDAGGHFFETALHTLRAAEERGYRPVLAANVSFRRAALLPPGWELHTPFRFHVFHARRAAIVRLRARAAQRRSAEPRGLRGWFSSGWIRLRDEFLRVRLEARQRRVIEDFASGVALVFRRSRVVSGDQVFVPTASATDVEALARFFRDEPAAGQAGWHLQFQFPLYDHQVLSERDVAGDRDAMIQVFRDCRSAIPDARLHFYAATEPLADHFGQLGVVRPGILPYPVDPAIHAAPRREPSCPLRAVCLGGIRAEKGPGNISAVVDRVWDDLFDSGRLQLLVQARSLEDLPETLRRRAVFHALPPGRREEAGKVAAVRWPLDSADYVRLLLDADIGLCIYRAADYYLRSSGVFFELLSAGVPVVVAAGTWMADQIAERIYEHRDRLRGDSRVVASVGAASIRWRRTDASVGEREASEGSRLEFGAAARAVEGELPVPPEAGRLFVSFRCKAPLGTRVFARIEIQQLDERRTPLETVVEVLGSRRDSPVPVFMPLRAGVRSIRVTWSNALGDTTLAVDPADFHFHARGPGVEDDPPRGAVGLVAADDEGTAAALRDIVRHHAHYRRTAIEFSDAWSRFHYPGRLVETLADSAEGLKRASDPSSSPRMTTRLLGPVRATRPAST
jgi:hypothetical protein